MWIFFNGRSQYASPRLSPPQHEFHGIDFGWEGATAFINGSSTLQVHISAAVCAVSFNAPISNLVLPRPSMVRAMTDIVMAADLSLQKDTRILR